MFVVFEVADADRLSVVPLDGPLANPVREFARAADVAALVSAVEDAGIAEVLARRRIAEREAAGDGPVILRFPRGASVALAEIDDAS